MRQRMYKDNNNIYFTVNINFYFKKQLTNSTVFVKKHRSRSREIFNRVQQPIVTLLLFL